VLTASFVAAAVLAALPHNDEAAELLRRADALYARRAEGARGATANPGPIDAAIAAYKTVLKVDDGALDARAGLMRAIFFRGSFCGTPPDEQVRLFEEAKQIADDTVQKLERPLGAVKGPLRIAALHRIPAAPQVYFWAAVSWGQWSVDHKLAAAWQAAASRIRDLAQTVVELDPAMDQGSAYLILGRLHSECPRIPMLTRWISRTQAVAFLRLALETGPDNTPNMFFLADALLTHQPARADEARQLLERCARAEPRPAYAVEDAHYALVARERLATLPLR
jgi:tetratricopeptide (TPR) repeat protein